MPTYHLSKDALAPAAVRDAVPATMPRIIDVEPAEIMAPLPERVRQVQTASDPGMGRQLRRLALIWFRIYVWEQDTKGHESRVNLRIPIPVPVIGVFLRRKLSQQQALKLLSVADGVGGTAEAVDRVAESLMGFEFIRVEENKRGKREIVVLGFD